MTDSQKSTLKDVSLKFADKTEDEIRSDADAYVQAASNGEIETKDDMEEWVAERGYDHFADFKNHLQAYDLIEYMQNQ